MGGGSASFPGRPEVLEFVVPGGKRKDGDWLGPPFAGKHFVQFVTLDQKERPRPDIARQWVHHLAVAIREKDKRHLITVGLVDWSLDRKGLTSGFVPGKVAGGCDRGADPLHPGPDPIHDELDQPLDVPAGDRVHRARQAVRTCGFVAGAGGFSGLDPRISCIT